MTEHTAYLIFSFSIIIYFFLHSYFSEKGPKKIAQKLFASSNYYYRITYNVLSIIGLLALVYYYFVMPNDVLMEGNIVLRIVGTMLLVSGFTLASKAMKSYNGSEFIGTYQMKTGQDYHPESLNISGMNKHVRHPLYFSTLIFVWGLFLLILNVKFLIITIIVTLYLIIGTKNEEKKLVKEFGDDYKKYQKDVPMLIPFPKRNKRE